MLKRFLLASVAVLALAWAGPPVFAERETGSALRPTEHVSAEAERAGAHGAGDVEEKPALIPDPGSRETWLEALWVVIIFVIMLAILYPTAWKSVLAGLKAREQRIRSDIAEAEAARAKAETTLREYTARLAAAENSVREMLSKATAEGEQIAAQLRTRAQQESEETKEKALRDIEAAKVQAVDEVYQQAAILATSVAEKILRRNLSAEDQRDLVTRSLEQIQDIGKN